MTLTLDVKTPDYLIAQADLASARTTLRRLERQPGDMVSRNAEHFAEVTAADITGNTLKTNGQVLDRGNGSGYAVTFRACACDGTTECLHDPRVPPYSAADIAKAEKAVVKARKAVAKAAATLADTPVAWDAFAAARDAGATHVWWPQDERRDPRRYRTRGQPVSPEELAALGPRKLNHEIQAGGIVQVPT
jgi:hypothetical protein